MARITFTRDSRGIAAILASTDFGQHAAADAIASQVRAAHPDVEVVVDQYTAQGGRLSPRPASSVTIAHPRGRGLQARDGTLTKAAAAQGLQVSG